MSLLFTGKFALSPDVISQEYMGETILLNKKTLVYVRLDALGGGLWQLFEQNDDAETVSREFKTGHKLQDEQAEKFMNQMAGNFEKLGWISFSDSKN